MNRGLIIEKLPLHRDCFSAVQSDVIYVRDYKHYDLHCGNNSNSPNRGVVISSSPDPKWASAVLFNLKPEELVIEADCFPENALPEDEAGRYASQCECLLFPSDGENDDWTLFIETKYTDDVKTAVRPTINYPDKMFRQIKSTVDYLRNRGILDMEKRVHAIMSFPKLLEPFDSWSFPIKDVDDVSGAVSYLMPADILQHYHIHARFTNKASIKSKKRIKLGL